MENKTDIILIRGKLLTVVFILFVILSLSGCESNYRFYRPNLPEILCIIGMIDPDTSLSYLSSPTLFPEFPSDSINTHSISFEKSYQTEYPDELSDSLRDFSFTISSPEGILFNYQSDKAIRNLFRFELPDSIKFSSCKKYFLEAKEKNCPEISAEITVPQPPLIPELISIEKEHVAVSKPSDVWGDTDTIKSVVIRFFFKKNNEPKQYYAFIMDGNYRIHTWHERFFCYLDFSVQECNSTGFFVPWHGLYVRHYSRPPGGYYMGEAAPVSAFFIDGSKIPGDNCEITVSTQFHGLCTSYSYQSISDWENFYSIRLKLLSIPEELYLFEKSLYNYKKIKKDPFSEPLLLEGNIKGGNGVFAICRSTELIVNFNPVY